MLQRCDSGQTKILSSVNDNYEVIGLHNWNIMGSNIPCLRIDSLSFCFWTKLVGILPVKGQYINELISFLSKLDLVGT